MKSLTTIKMIALLAITSCAVARPIPNLICQESRSTFIDPISLVAQARESQNIYRFKSGNMYIKPVDRSEYLYNKVTETEPMRYISAHKIIQFEGSGQEFQSVVLVHAYKDDVRVSRATCKKL